MAFADDVIDDLAIFIVNALAPYQPSVPSFPNTDTRAGSIPPTLVTGGHPIQIKVTTRLENKMCQIGVFDQQPERIFPYINTDPVGVDADGNVTFEVGGSEKRFCVEIWGYDRTSRRKIRDRVRAALTDFFRLRHSDNTTTLLTYLDDVTFDDEQRDSFYIAQMHFQGNFTILGSAPGAPITSMSVGLTVQDTNVPEIDIVVPNALEVTTVVTDPNTQIPERTAFTYHQTPAVTQWRIEHNLGYNPGFAVYDDDGLKMYPSSENPDQNTLILTFPMATLGTAYLTAI